MSMPARDRLMGLVLLALMLAGDAAVAVIHPHTRFKAAFVLMPATFLLIWSLFAASLWLCRRLKDPAIEVRGQIMGGTLSAVGVTLTVVHAGLLGMAAGWIADMDFPIVFRLMAVGLGLNLAMLGNRLAKVARWPWLTVSGNGRGVGWVMALSGLAVALMGVALPFEVLEHWVLPVAMIGPLFIMANIAVTLVMRRMAPHT